MLSSKGHFKKENSSCFNVDQTLICLFIELKNVYIFIGEIIKISNALGKKLAVVFVIIIIIVIF